MSESNWTFLIGVILTLGQAYIGFLIVRARGEVKEVKSIVDGPLSVALKSNADLTRRIAAITREPSDFQAAAKAQVIAENREEGKNIA